MSDCPFRPLFEAPQCSLTTNNKTRPISPTAFAVPTADTSETVPSLLRSAPLDTHRANQGNQPNQQLERASTHPSRACRAPSSLCVHLTAGNTKRIRRRHPRPTVLRACSTSVWMVATHHPNAQGSTIFSFRSALLAEAHFFDVVVIRIKLESWPIGWGFFFPGPREMNDPIFAKVP